VVNQLALRLEPDKLDRDIELVVLEPLFKLAFELLLDMSLSQQNQRDPGQPLPALLMGLDPE